VRYGRVPFPFTRRIISDRLEIAKDAAGRWHIRDFGRDLATEHLTQNENREAGQPREGRRQVSASG
jgi:hypothetical protein